MPPIRGWKSGVWLWACALLFVPLYLYLAPRIKRAMTAYLLAAAALLPSCLAILDGSLRLSFGLLGQGPAIVKAASCLLGLGTVPFAVHGRRRWFQEALQAYIALALGYSLTYFLLVGAMLQFLELRRLEAGSSRPVVHLLPDRGAT